MYQDIIKNNRAISRQVVEPNSWMWYQQRQVALLIDWGKKRWKRDLLKLLSSQVDWVHIQDCAFWGAQLEVSQCKGNGDYSISPAKSLNKWMSKWQQFPEGREEWVSWVAILCYLKCPVFNNKKWDFQINNVTHMAYRGLETRNRNHWWEFRHQI